MELGVYNRLTALKVVDFGFYLTDGNGENVLLPRKYVPQNLKVGDTLEVFVYLDSEDRPVATTHYPRAKVGDIAGLKCVDVNKIGAFFDWGLEKDLLVPYGEQHEPMRPGKNYLVKVLYDPTSKRIIGSDRFDRLCTADASILAAETAVEAVVWEQLELGFKCVIDGRYIGMIYHSECRKPLKVGDKITAFVTKVRPDNRVDLRSRPSGRAAALTESDKVLFYLRQNGGFYAYTPRTTPIEIEQKFGISKRLFKQAIGNLYKQHLLRIEDDGLHLIGDAEKAAQKV